MSDNTTIQIDRDVKQILDRMGVRGESMNDIIKRLIDISNNSNTVDLKTATVDSHGKASISRTLAGKTIEYRVKQ